MVELPVLALLLMILQPGRSLTASNALQESIINNLALRWEDAEEAKLRAGHEDMQQGNPNPVRISPAKRVSNLLWRSQPKVEHAQPPDACAKLLQIPKVRFCKVQV